MKDEFPWVSCVRVSVEVPGGPWDHHEAFVHEIKGTIIGMTNDTDEDELGTLEAIKLSACEAMNQHFSLEQVCDSHSDFLLSAYHAVFDEDEETQPDLEIEPAWQDVLVLWEIKLKPEYRKPSVAVKALEGAISFFAPQGLIIAAMEGEDFIGLDLTIEEWRELGFVKVAGTQFVFRDNCKKNPYTFREEQEEDE